MGFATLSVRRDFRSLCSQTCVPMNGMTSLNAQFI